MKEHTKVTWKWKSILNWHEDEIVYVYIGTLFMALSLNMTIKMMPIKRYDQFNIKPLYLILHENAHSHYKMEICEGLLRSNFIKFSAVIPCNKTGIHMLLWFQSCRVNQWFIPWGAISELGRWIAAQ